MRKSLVLTLAAGLLLAVLATPARSLQVGGANPPIEPPTTAIVPAPAELVATRAELLDRIRNGETPSLAVGVVRGETILWEEALGWADREPGEAGLPATPDTRYPVASVSKSMTATAALALVARGALRLDQPVQEALGDLHLPATGEPVAGVLVSHLLAHTSGIPHLVHYEYPDRPATLATRQAQIRQHAFVASPPGEHYLYSNLGYSVLAEVVARAGSAPFEAVMARELFGPLGMRQTTLDAWAGDEGAVRGYDGEGHALPYRYRLAPDGGAGYFSTLDDLLRYARFHLGAAGAGAPTAEAAVATALGSLPPGVYFRGWGVVRMEGATLFLSDGEMAGATAVVMVVPEKRLAVVALSSSTGGPAGEAAVAILGALVPGFDDELMAAIGELRTELATPVAELSGRFEGTLVDGETKVPASIDFADPEAPVLELDGQRFLLQIRRWDRGSLRARVDGSLPIGAGKGRTHRLDIALWPRPGGLRGVVQEDFDDDRPLWGVPHFLDLEAVPAE